MFGSSDIVEVVAVVVGVKELALDGDTKGVTGLCAGEINARLNGNAIEVSC